MKASRLAAGAATVAALLLPVSLISVTQADAAPLSLHGASAHHAVHMTPAGTIDGGFSLIASNSGGANLRASWTMDSYSEEYLPNRTEVLMMCWITGQDVKPPNSNYESNRWFRVEPAYDPNIGYVHSSLVTDQAIVPPC